MPRLGADSPAAFLASDPMLVRYFYEDIVRHRNCLDLHAAGVRCTIADDLLSLSLNGCGTCLAKEGYTAGTHRWAVHVESTGQCTWLGVAAKPIRLDQWLVNEPTGFGVGGQSMVSADPHSAYHGLKAYERVPFFNPGDTVLFTLDLDVGSLTVDNTRKKHHTVLLFDGQLKAMTPPLYPAFAGFDGPTRIKVDFDL
jgi:hypothetical protein